MHPLQCCDFCDGDALGTFEALPPELEPTDAEQRRLVLCGECKDRLEDVLEPLFARLGVDQPGDEPAERTATAITIGTDESDGSADPRKPGVDSSDPDAAEGLALEDSEERSDSSHAEEPLSAGETSEKEGGETDDELEETARPPRAYAKVMRLLRNREFPMERAAVESLAAGAYDLEAHEAAAIVDYAIDDGELLEDGGTLRRS